MCYVLCAIFARNEKVVTSVEISNKMHLYLVSCIQTQCLEAIIEEKFCKSGGIHP